MLRNRLDYLLATGILGIALLAPVAVARADGGKVRYQQIHGNLKVTVSINPTAPRVGPVEVNVLTQDANSNKTRLDIPVSVEVSPTSDPKKKFGGPATNEAATNKIYKSILLDIPDPGGWNVRVTLQQPDGLIRFLIPLEVAQPQPAWMAYGPWIAWPLAMGFFLFLHRYMLRRRMQVKRLPGVK